MKILTTLSQPNDEHGILPNSKLSTTNGKKSQTPIVCWARADREMLSIRHFPRLDGLLSRPFELRNPPASSSTSLPGTEVRWGVVRPALATAMAGYCKGDPRLGLAGSPVLELSNNERNALGIPVLLAYFGWCLADSRGGNCSGCPGRGESQRLALYRYLLWFCELDYSCFIEVAFPHSFLGT